MVQVCHLMLVLVLRMLRYWRMSGTVISRRALRNLRPKHNLLRTFLIHFILTYPSPVQVDRDEGGGNGEVVHEGVELQHEPELVRGSDKLREKRGKYRTLFLIK